MTAAGTRSRDDQGARAWLRKSLTRSFPALVLLLFLLIGGLPCATIFGCGCPCPEAAHDRSIAAPADCCEGSTDLTLILSLPSEPQRALAAPPMTSAESPGAAAAPLLRELPRLSLAAEKLYDPPPLILLLCTLLN